jgi:4-hydroxy-tetrahydrodipicolinate reductase
MNILLIGYGKMGKAIEQIALHRGHTIIARVDNSHERESLSNTLQIDVAIEFSQPEVAVDNLLFCFQRKINSLGVIKFKDIQEK